MKRSHALAPVVVAGTLAAVLWLVLRARPSDVASRTVDERTAHTAADSLDLDRALAELRK